MDALLQGRGSALDVPSRFSKDDLELIWAESGEPPVALQTLTKATAEQTNRAKSCEGV